MYLHRITNFNRKRWVTFTKCLSTSTPWPTVRNINNNNNNNRNTTFTSTHLINSIHLPTLRYIPTYITFRLPASLFHVTPPGLVRYTRKYPLGARSKIKRRTELQKYIRVWCKTRARKSRITAATEVVMRLQKPYSRKVIRATKVCGFSKAPATFIVVVVVVVNRYDAAMIPYLEIIVRCSSRTVSVCWLLDTFVQYL